MMKDKSFKMIALAVFVLAGSCVLPINAAAKTKRHLMIHGGLSVFNYARIAEKIDYLVISVGRPDLLAKMKEINPDLTILRYHHTLGVHRKSPFWDSANRHSDLIVRDRISGKRMVEKKYGWYLLDVSSENWRQHVTEKIAAHTPEVFDGVFLDDFWPDFVNKFVAAGGRQTALPPEHMIRDWKKHLIALLTHLRSVYPKAIFINGLDEDYIHHVDGCMEEGFVHGNWESDQQLRNPSKFLRSIINTRKLSTYGKTILVQSGTRGDYPENIERIFRLCFSSYLLIQNEFTTFGFHPLYTYYFKDFPPYDTYRTDLGTPLGPYQSQPHESHPPNLVPNADFRNGLKGWKIDRGKPRIDTQTQQVGESIVFTGSATGRDKIKSGFIPVLPETEYRLAAVCKAENNRPGSKTYMKFGLQGRFFDRDKQKLAGAYDLKFDAGTYGWMPFEITHRSPKHAAYMQLRIGFIGDGTGRGWIDRTYLGLHKSAAQTMRRYFSKGAALVNYGSDRGRVEVVDPRPGGRRRTVVIDAADGRILSWQPPPQ